MKNAPSSWWSRSSHARTGSRRPRRSCSPCAGNSLEEPGCVFMHLVQPQDDPDNWVMLEMFRSRAAWDEHMQQPYNTEGNKILEDLLREPSELRLMDEK